MRIPRSLPLFRFSIASLLAFVTASAACFWWVKANRTFHWELVGLELSEHDGSLEDVVSPEIAQSYPWLNAVRIASVDENSPAQFAGLSEGDLLVAVDRWATFNLDQVETLAAHPHRLQSGPWVEIFVAHDNTIEQMQIYVEAATQNNAMHDESPSRVF